MKRSSLLIAILIIVTQIINAQEFEWAHIFGKADNLTGMAIDSYNNSYVSSMGGTYTDFSIDNAGTLYGPSSICSAIHKFDDNGNNIWTKFIHKVSGGAIIYVYEMIAKDSTLFITGVIHFTNPSVIDFDPGPGTALDTVAYATQAYSSYLVKLDLDGNYISHLLYFKSYLMGWSRFCVDTEDNVYQACHYMDYLEHDSVMLPYSGNYGIFITKISNNGEIEWLDLLSSNGGMPNTPSIDINSTNDLYVSGGTPDNLYFKKDSSITQFSNFYGNLFIMKLDDATGNLHWCKLFGNNEPSSCYDLDIDPLGNLIITGGMHFNPNATLDLDPAINSSYIVNSVGAFVVKLDSAGNFIWGNGYEVSTDFRPYAVDCSPPVSENLADYDIAIAGFIKGTCDFDSSTGTFELSTATIANDHESFITTINSDGDFIWAGLQHNTSTTADSYARAVSWTNTGIYTKGFLHDTIDFNPDTTNSYLLGPTNYSASYLSKLSLCTETNYVHVDACDVYYWQEFNQTLTLSGYYVDTITYSSGCETIINLDLNIYQSSASNLSATACDSYLLNGQFFDSSGTYQQIITNAAGCDSIITIDLTIYEATESYLSDTACYEYWLNGELFDTTGIYQQTLVNAEGCDSIIYLDLTIRYSPNPVITMQSNFTLATEYFSNCTYEWFDCNSQFTIPNETTNTYVLTGSGSFAVIVTNECGTDTSDCFIFNDIPELINEAILISPNPASKCFNIYVPNTIMPTEYLIYNSLGELVRNSIIESNKETVNTQNWQAGIYYIQLKGIQKKIVIY